MRPSPEVLGVRAGSGRPDAVRVVWLVAYCRIVSGARSMIVAPKMFMALSVKRRIWRGWYVDMMDKWE